MIRFAIIIPFRPKAESVDWQKESFLLKETVTSILQQTYSGIHVYVVHNEAPEHQISDERVTYVAFPFGHQRYEEMENRQQLLTRFKSEKLVVRRWDKARKLSYGCQLAKENGADYLMAMDADDKLSKYFFERLNTEAVIEKVPGWYMHCGYLYKEHSKYLIRIPQSMRSFNGSTHVLHQTLVRIPDFRSVIWEDFNLFTDHGWIKERLLQEYGVELKQINFPALVYVVHNSNISQVQKEFAFSFRKMIKRFLRSVRITPQLREEFNFPQ